MYPFLLLTHALQFPIFIQSVIVVNNRMRIPTTVLMVAIRPPIERYCGLGWGAFLCALVDVSRVFVELKVEPNDDLVSSRTIKDENSVD